LSSKVETKRTCTCGCLYCAAGCRGDELAMAELDRRSMTDAMNRCMCPCCGGPETASAEAQAELELLQAETLLDQITTTLRVSIPKLVSPEDWGDFEENGVKPLENLLKELDARGSEEHEEGMIQQ
jgi:hypothetical protein